MTHYIKTLIAALAVAALSSGCVIATGPGSVTTKSAAQGAGHCMTSDDGKAVACGGKAEACLASSDGKAVACGGMADHCLKSSDGRAVACGGRANYCEKSSDGKAVACGGGVN